VDHLDYWSTPPNNRQETLEYALDLSTDFEPGEDYDYSKLIYSVGLLNGFKKHDPGS